MRYVGSKNRLSRELVPIIQSYITSETKGYLEPFVGGANMIDKINCDKKYGCDIHEELIALLQQAQLDCNVFPMDITEEKYHEVKNNKEQYDKWYVGLVGFMATFGNKYFGGVARNKTKGIQEYYKESIDCLLKQVPNLKGVIFKNCSFKEINKTISDYVIYCDPPYRDTTKYKTEKFPYDDFYDWCREMSKNNIVLISEYNMPDDFECIWSKEVNVGLDSNRKAGDKNNNRTEKLFIIK